MIERQWNGKRSVWKSRPGLERSVSLPDLRSLLNTATSVVLQSKSPQVTCAFPAKKPIQQSPPLWKCKSSPFPSSCTPSVSPPSFPTLPVLNWSCSLLPWGLFTLQAFFLQWPLLWRPHSTLYHILGSLFKFCVSLISLSRILPQPHSFLTSWVV